MNWPFTGLQSRTVQNWFVEINQTLHHYFCIWTLSESFPIAYIVHYMPSITQEMLKQVTDFSLNFSVYL